MLLGVIADDFTGASDIANTLAKGLPGQGGLRTTQYLGIPNASAASDVDAGVVSLKSRSIQSTEAVSLSLAALDWLQAQGCRQFVFKYCSTFDSTPAGNIGPVAEALAKRLNVRGVVACPAFPTTGRTVFQGHLFVKDMLLSESGMQSHPLNPMTDSNLRRWLARQCDEPVGLVAWAVVAEGEQAVGSALRASGAAGARLAIVDAIRDEDLVVIARACRDAPLLTGGSGIAMGLPGNFITAGLATGSRPATVGLSGPEAILAGSCSTATLQQVEVHASSHPALALDVTQIMDQDFDPKVIVRFVVENEGRAPLVYSSMRSEQVRDLQSRYGSDRVATRLDSVFAKIARMLVDSGVKRLVVAGGETSGAVVSALGINELAIGPEIDPGVPVLSTNNPRPLALALKSGNFGSPDFFVKALDHLQSGH